MRRKLWMFVHDLAEKLWHYAYHQAYPSEKRELFTRQYNVTYTDKSGNQIPFDGTVFRSIAADQQPDSSS